MCRCLGKNMAQVSKTVQRACQLLKARARFERAAFRLPGSALSDADRDTKLIREATRLYTETWIVPLLDAIERGDLRTLARRISS